MQSLIELFKQLLTIVVKNPETLQLVNSVLDFLKANPQLIETVKNWLSGTFGSTEGEDGLPDELDQIKSELMALKACQDGECDEECVDDCDPDKDCCDE